MGDHVPGRSPRGLRPSDTQHQHRHETGSGNSGPGARATAPGHLPVVSDAGFADGALRLNRWAAKYAPVYAYEFEDDSAPQRYTPPGFLAPIATHGSELQYLFDLPSTPVKATLNSAQERLAASMREAWADFAAGKAPWPEFGSRERVMSFNTTRSQLETKTASSHHADLWQ